MPEVRAPVVDGGGEMMETYWPFKCPQCGDTVDRTERVYDVELDMDVCQLCAENLRDERVKPMRYSVRVDTKPGVVPSMAATFEIDAPRQRIAEQQAVRQLAAAAGVPTSKVRVRKTELVREAV